MAGSDASRDDGFEVEAWIDKLGGFITRHRPLWIALGNLETRLVRPAISTTTVDRPIYIAGLARSGSTILLETLARHPDVATHRYRDYPPVFTPYLWNSWLDRMPRRKEKERERTHKDGIKVTSESPEAFEEVLWMAFFPDLHDPGRTAVLDHTTCRPDFETFYRDHIRKLLAIRRACRYISKANYNVTRLGYLQRLFPEARFIIPVRDPAWHIASLLKQHRLFVEGQRAHPRAIDHLRRVGHYEFGLDRRPINIGDPRTMASIEEDWREGREAAGWAHYWAMMHDFLADCLASNQGLREASLVVRFEDLCRAPRDILRSIFEHCQLDFTDEFVETMAARIRFPAYYAPSFTSAELDLIARRTCSAARRFGYEAEISRADLAQQPTRATSE